MKDKNKIIFIFAAAAVLFGTARPVLCDTAKDQLIQLNDQITAKKNQVDSLNGQIQTYQTKIDGLENQELSLANQIAILENQIAKSDLDIQSAQAQIDEIGLELQSLDGQISDASDRLDNDRSLLADLVRKIDREDEQTGIETMFLSDNFSALFSRAKYLEDLQGDMLKTIKTVQDAKTQLEASQAERVAKDAELRATKDQLEVDKIKLQDDHDSKEYLVDKTRNSEYQFRNFVAGLQSEESQVSGDLSALQAQAQQKLRDVDMFPSGNIVLSWPVPSRVISTSFHDPNYPFRRIMEHPGIDIGQTPQKTPVHAAAPGYVLKAKDSGYGYSYVIIMHGSGIATVYGHLSHISVVADSYVNRGDVIGLSGGTPGTLGAGPMTTGPHLHFEVRADGIPVDPMNYLVQ
jgi:murein DD-endopeptidase MepM/ murein hydrolase activator NlpD